MRASIIDYEQLYYKIPIHFHELGVVLRHYKFFRMKTRKRVKVAMLDTSLEPAMFLSFNRQASYVWKYHYMKVASFPYEYKNFNFKANTW